VTARAARGLATRLVVDVAANLGFFTRLPSPAFAQAKPDWPQIAWAAPLAGAIVGAIGGLTLGIALVGLDLPPMVSATLAVAALTLVTGALHEDGLADVADGFGGGATREAKLAIMRDSRIGAFGATALGLGLILRIAAIAALTRSGLGFAVAGITLAGAAARAGALAPLALLPPARSDGAGAGALGVDGSHLTAAALSLIAVAGVAGILALDVTRALFACVIAAAVGYGACALARRPIGGQTGDVAGASAQICEMAALCALLIGGRAV
jgi:adenosylcobinamide-GDP ribazoletransferase